MRLDLLLVKRGYFSSRQRAKDYIRRGFVLVNGVRITKPSAEVDFNAKIEVLAEEKPRGYWKLKEIDERLKIFTLSLDSSIFLSSSSNSLLYSIP